jgi:hypothetical protein
VIGGWLFWANQLMVISLHNLQQFVYNSATKGSKIIRASIMDAPVSGYNFIHSSAGGHH